MFCVSIAENSFLPCDCNLPTAVSAHPKTERLGSCGCRCRYRLTRISRTVQWIREAACLPSAGWRRELEEAALTGIYLSTFAYWLNDDSPGAARTHTFLDRSLAIAEQAALQMAPRE